MAEQGFVYFIRAESGYHKIGKSVEPAERLEALASESKQPLHLSHIVFSNDPYWLETKLHRYFAYAHVQGEWFDLDDEELEAVKGLHRCDRLIVRGRCFDSRAVKSVNLASQAAAMGKKGGKSRAESLTAARRKEIARLGGLARAAKRSKSFPPPMTD